MLLFMPTFLMESVDDSAFPFWNERSRCKIMVEGDTDKLEHWIVKCRLRFWLRAFAIWPIYIQYITKNDFLNHTSHLNWKSDCSMLNQIIRTMFFILIPQFVECSYYLPPVHCGDLLGNKRSRQPNLQWKFLQKTANCCFRSRISPLSREVLIYGPHLK